MPAGDDAILDRTVVALLAVVALLLIGGVAIGAITSGASGGIVDTAGSTSTDRLSADQQRNPSELGDSRGLSAIERRLAQRIAQRIQSGSINLSRGQYARVRSTLNSSRYGTLLDQYSEIADESNTVNQSKLFQQMRRDQQAYATAAESYWDLYALYNGTANVSKPEYQRLLSSLEFVAVNETSVASTNSTANATLSVSLNTTQHRKLARKMSVHWQYVDHNATQLIDTYNRLERHSAENYSSAIASIRASRRNVSETQQRIQQAWLTDVTLSAVAIRPHGSFTDPIVIRGQLAAGNRTPISSETIRLDVAGRPHRTTVNESGWFTLAYRPVAIPLNTTTVSVRYVPKPSSQYTAASSNVSVDVARVTPSVSVQVTPEVVRFNETIAISGRVTADDIGVSRVPYLVTVNGTFLVQGRTAANGTFEETAVIPASLSRGTHRLRVSLLGTNRALAPASENTSIRVQEYRSSLSLSAASGDGRSVHVSGRLTVPEAGGVAGKRIQIVVRNTTLTTATTDADGTFNTTIVLPRELSQTGLLARSTKLPISARYASSGSSIMSSRARATITVRSDSPIPTLGGIAIAVIVLITGYLGYSRWWPQSSRSDDPSSTSTAASISEHWNEGPDSDASLLSQAHAELEADRPEVAVQFGYAALRTRLERRFGIESTNTPWEFYRAIHRHDEDGDLLEELRRLTELYERAVFASESVSGEAAERVLTRIDSLADETSTVSD